MNSTQGNWYDLFSRGARDWLRHNQKVRDAVQAHLPDLIATPDLLTGTAERTVQVPVRLLEHARFRLADPRNAGGAGQGDGQTGTIVRPASAGQHSDADDGAGGDEDGEVRLLLEFSIDDVLDWLWHEFKLPLLKPKRTTMTEDQELVREGWDKRGARSRLDRRRTVKEAIKRRAMQEHPVAFTNEDLRFRQLVVRRKPSTSAVVFLVLDVSASMTLDERKLAKAFFFYALHGIRRQYRQVETRFIAHTTQAWEFSEDDFFRVTGIGGTIASSAFKLALELVHIRYDPTQYNVYMFYASDGENFTEDRNAASRTLADLGAVLNSIAYVETVPGMPRSQETEMRRICNDLERRGLPVASSVLANAADVWTALRKFLVQQEDEKEIQR